MREVYWPYGQGDASGNGGGRIRLFNEGWGRGIRGTRRGEGRARTENGDRVCASAKGWAPKSARRSMAERPVRDEPSEVRTKLISGGSALWGCRSSGRVP